MNKFKKSQVLVFFVLLLLLAIIPYLPSTLRTTYLYFISINFIIIALGAEAGLFSPFVIPLEDTKHSASVIIPQEAFSEKREASNTAGLSVVSENVKIKKDTKQFASVIIPQEASSEKREASNTAGLSAVSENVEIKKHTKHSASVIIPQEASSEKREASNTAGLSAVSENVEIKKVKAVEKSAFKKAVSVIEVDKVQKGPSSRLSLVFIGNGEDDAEVMDEEIEAEVEIEGVKGQELFAKAEVFIGNFYKQLKMQRVSDLSESLLINRTALASSVEY